MDKQFKIRLIIGSILFGIIVFGKELFNGGIWNPVGFLWIIYGSVGFGVLFYALFGLMMKEKRDDSDASNTSGK